jgi:hypothetical protein
MREKGRKGTRVPMRNGRRIGCNATEKVISALSWGSSIWITHECNTTALSNHGEEQESETRHDMESK